MDTYKSTNTTNGKFYVGSTNNFEKRKREHLNSNENYPFQNALRKNPEVFEWECWTDDCDEPVLEQALLDMWYGTEQCYNLCPHANRPQFNLESSRQTGIRSLEEKWGLFDPRHKEKLRAVSVQNGKKVGRAAVDAKKGIHSQSKEEKVDCGKVGGRSCLEKKVGIHNPDLKEELNRVRVENAQKASKPVLCVSTGVTYPSASAAARETKVPQSNISKCCRKERQNAGGYTWEFALKQG
jgi:group I intron endonuclease